MSLGSQIFLTFCLSLSFQSVWAEDAEPINIDGHWDNTLNYLSENRGLHKVTKDPAILSEKGARVLGKIMDLLKRIPPELSVSDSIKLIEGGKFGVKYKFSVQPHLYQKGYTRLDEWEVNLKANLLRFAGLDTRYNFTVYPRIKLRFYQDFASKKKAAHPKRAYTPARLPQNSEELLKKLKPGDLVEIEGNLAHIYGYAKLWDEIVDWLSFNGSVGAAVHGQFKMFIYRGENGVARVRITGQRSTPRFIHARLKVFDVITFSWSRLAEILERALDLDELFLLQYEKIDSDNWVADYTLDLKKPEIRKAFDRVASSKDHLKLIHTAANPFSEKTEYRKNLRNHVWPLTKLAKVGKAKQNSMGSQFSGGGLSDYTAGVRGLFRGEQLTKNQVDRLAKDNLNFDGGLSKSYFAIPTWYKYQSQETGPKRYERRNEQMTSSFFSTDRHFKAKRHIAMGFWHNFLSERFTEKEKNKIFDKLNRQLPERVYANLMDHLNKNGWDKVTRKKKKMMLSARYLFGREAFKKLNSPSPDQIARAIVGALQEVDDKTGLTVSTEPPPGSAIPRCSVRQLRAWGAKVSKRKYVGDRVGHFCKKIPRLAKRIAVAIDKNMDPHTRYKKFAQLPNSRLFQFVGSGVLFDLLSSKNLENMGYFEITIYSESLKKTLQFVSGQFGDGETVELVQGLQKQFFDRLPDLRP